MTTLVMPSKTEFKLDKKAFKAALLRALLFVTVMHLLASYKLFKNGARLPLVSRDPLTVLAIFAFLLFVYYINRAHKKLANIVLGFWVAFLIGGYFFLKSDVIHFVEWQGYTHVSLVGWAEDCSTGYDVGFIVHGVHPWAGVEGETQACFDLFHGWRSSWIAQ